MSPMGSMKVAGIAQPPQESVIGSAWVAGCLPPDRVKVQTQAWTAGSARPCVGSVATVCLGLPGQRMITNCHVVLGSSILCPVSCLTVREGTLASSFFAFVMSPPVAIPRGDSPSPCLWIPSTRVGAGGCPPSASSLPRHHHEVHSLCEVDPSLGADPCVEPSNGSHPVLRCARTAVGPARGASLHGCIRSFVHRERAVGSRQAVHHRAEDAQ